MQDLTLLESPVGRSDITRNARGGSIGALLLLKKPWQVTVRLHSLRTDVIICCLQFNYLLSFARCRDVLYTSLLQMAEHFIIAIAKSA